MPPFSLTLFSRDALPGGRFGGLHGRVCTGHHDHEADHGPIRWKTLVPILSRCNAVPFYHVRDQRPAPNTASGSLPSRFSNACSRPTESRRPSSHPARSDSCHGTRRRRRDPTPREAFMTGGER